jgi:hypothetical protein
MLSLSWLRSPARIITTQELTNWSGNASFLGRIVWQQANRRKRIRLICAIFREHFRVPATS